jgi:hypothetical protein
MKKKTKSKVGDLFHIPLADGRFGVGQIVDQWMGTVICIAVFGEVHNNVTQKLTAAVDSLKVISLPSVSKSEIDKGYWPVFDTAAVQLNLELAPHHQFASSNYVGASWDAGGVVEKLLNAYFCGATWEPYPGRPGHLTSLLLKI